MRIYISASLVVLGGTFLYSASASSLPAAGVGHSGAASLETDELLIPDRIVVTPSLEPPFSGHIDASKFRKVIVIPDVHGDMEALIESLWIGLKQVESTTSSITVAHLLDTFKLRMSLPRTGTGVLPEIEKDDTVALVQLGDLMDRGPFSIECIRIINLVTEVLGWNVVALFGNHELMNMAGTAGRARYIKVDDMGGFSNRTDRINAVQPGGVFYSTMTGSFIAMARLGGSDAASSTLFVHGGLDMKWLKRKVLIEISEGGCLGLQGPEVVECVNRIFSRLVVNKEGVADLEDNGLQIEVFKRLEEEIHDRPYLHARFELEMRMKYGNNPMWSRTLAEKFTEMGYIGCGDSLETLLELFQVSRIIVGHTPQYDREVKSRCGGKIILADIAMSKWIARDGAPRYPVALIINPTAPTLAPPALFTLSQGLASDMSTGSIVSCELKDMLP